MLVYVKYKISAEIIAVLYRYSNIGSVYTMLTNMILPAVQFSRFTRENILHKSIIYVK